MGNFEFDIGFFHRLEQRPLNAGSGDIRANHAPACRNFVNFIKIDDAVLRQFNVAVCFCHRLLLPPNRAPNLPHHRPHSRFR